MKRFSELGIERVDDRKMFDCDQVSITDIVNCEIDILDFIPDVKTKFGGDRYLMHFRYSNTKTEGKLFSNSTNIKSDLDQVDKQDFPFSTIIRGTKCGKGKIYQFT